MKKVIDNQVFELKEDHDFEWLKSYGTVFKVFDQNDSGNISFGCVKDDKKIFIKYAGAKTVNYSGKEEDAIYRLEKAASVYEDIKHPVLINLIEKVKIGNGLALVFEYKDGECLHAHWDFDKYPKYTHPMSPTYKFKNLPLEKQLKSLDQIFDLHQLVSNKGYVAIDFYDGCIMYDFERDVTTICDIDLYAKRPFINQMGRLWGSSRFMSPEEFTKGSEIDEITNVFTMGATAFELLGSNRDRSIEKWIGPKSLYEVAKKAVSSERENRYQSLNDFISAWNNVKE